MCVHTEKGREGKWEEEFVVVHLHPRLGQHVCDGGMLRERCQEEEEVSRR